MLIQIRNYQFSLDEPFIAGQSISAGEARALNALRAERLREALTRRVVEAHKPVNVGQDGASRLLPAEVLTKLQLILDELAYRFVFPPPSEPKPKIGTIESVSRALAQEQVEADIRQSGLSMSEEQKEKLIEKALAAPAVQHEARRRIEARAAIAEAALRELMGPNP